jgi:hypothetical protein
MALLARAFGRMADTIAIVDKCLSAPSRTITKNKIHNLNVNWGFSYTIKESQINDLRFF